MASSPRSSDSAFATLLDKLPVAPDSWLGKRLALWRGEATAAPATGVVTFHAVEKVLSLYAIGLTGQSFAIKPARPNDASPFTDSAVVYLPPTVGEFPDEAQNFRLYKLMLAEQIAAIQNDTFNLHGELSTFTDDAMIADLYALVECARIERQLAAQYRGLANDIATARQDALRKRPDVTKATARTQAVESLIRWSLGGQPPADLPKKVTDVVRQSAIVLQEMMESRPKQHDSLRVATYLYNWLERLGGYYKPLPYVHFRGKMRTDLAAAVLEEQRRRRHPALTQQVTVDVVSQQVGVLKTRMADDMNVTPQKVVVREQLRAESVASGESDEHAIWLDVGQHKHAIEVALSESERHGAVLYDEWDCARGRYRPDWCALRERVVAPGAPDYVDSVLVKHRALVTQIKRQFDALRPEYRRLRKQPDGEDLDLDAIVEAMADRRAGSTPTDSLYIARQANRRDIGVVFLVDLSGSAGGWLRDHRIIDVERESLVLICEALQMLNDRYAIYGFSSSTRKQCDLFLIKDFAETYNHDVRLRIGGLHTFSYTRMGPPIRHLTRRLDQLDARIKLLMILSDGKPNDFDGYAGRYAIEDTRQALIEARMRSIRTYCLTIDSKARDYLPQMFGENGYSILDDVEKLPARLPDLYRRLTTR